MPVTRSETPISIIDDSFIDSQTESNAQSQINENANIIIPKPRKFVLTKYTIYSTTQRMYIVGSNTRETVFRILEIDFTNSEKLTIMEDNVFFSRHEIMEVLNGIENSSDEGLTKRQTVVGLLGFIKFTKGYYLIVVLKRREVAVLGSHEIYHIDQTDLIPVENNYKEPEKNSPEERYIQTFKNINLNTTFYFSYSYDLTNSLQTNMIRNKRQSLNMNGNTELSYVFQFNERFMWNVALLKPAFQTFDKVYDWFQPIIHGFVDQVKNSVFQKHFYITIIARRSHHFAGARFFKRGANDNGDVANEVETEQIVSDMLTSSFHDPGAGFYNNPRYTSFVQHRGSIPLSWSQETSPNLRMTKPPIELSVIDPYFSKAAAHFNDLFKRYGQPIQILNLIKQREKTPREMKLLDAFNECVDYLNLFLPEDKKLDYTAWDMSRAAKSRSQDVISWLEKYSENSLSKTGFFHNGKSVYDTKLQQGICRTNCVDCLDRTNTAQFVIGKRALGYQLHALGIIRGKYLEYDSDVTNVLTEMFHDHGDTIALQYGGSHLVNTLQTYRKINQWTSHSRDMIESVKRFYSNSFMDAQRQDAINLFLGNYVYSPGKAQLWDMNSDHYLHNTKKYFELNGTPSYRHWFTDAYLIDYKKDLVKQWEETLNNKFLVDLQERGLYIMKIEPYAGCFENYWNIKYGSRLLVSFSNLFEFQMNSTRQYSNNVESVKLYPSTSNTKTSKKTSRFGLFTLFKKHDNSTNEVSDTSSTYSKTASKRFNSFSERLRGNAPKHIFDPEYEEGTYFSPFKSRKPHRELKLLYGKTENEDVIIDDEIEDLRNDLEKHLSGLFQIDLDDLDKEEYKSYQRQYKSFLIILSQLQESKDFNKFYDEFKVTEKYLNDSGLPIIDSNITNEVFIKDFEAHYNNQNNKKPIEEIEEKNEDTAFIQDDEFEMYKSDNDDIEYSEKSNSFENDDVDESSHDDTLSLIELDNSKSTKNSLEQIAKEHNIAIPELDSVTLEFYQSSVSWTKEIPVYGMSEFCKNDNNLNNIGYDDDETVSTIESPSPIGVEYYNEDYSFNTFQDNKQNYTIVHHRDEDVVDKLVKEYTKLSKSYIDRDDIGKYQKHYTLLNEMKEFDTDKIKLEVPDIQINGNPNKEFSKEIDDIPEETTSMLNVTSGDSENYFSFKMLNRKSSKQVLQNDKK